MGDDGGGSELHDAKFLDSLHVYICFCVCVCLCVCVCMCLCVCVCLNANTRELKFVYRYYLNPLGGLLQLVVVLVFFNLYLIYIV